MQVKPPRGHAGLAALRRGLAIDLMLVTLLLAVTLWICCRERLVYRWKWVTEVGDGGVLDLRELKPLLLRWVMAALLRMDMDSMLAIRPRRRIAAVCAKTAK
jgi:hypothetical protein